MWHAEHTIDPKKCIELNYKGKRDQFVTPNVSNQDFSGQVIKVSILEDLQTPLWFERASS